MAKVVKCRDLGFDCEGVIRADSEDEALQMVADHAGSVHDLNEITPEIVLQVKSVMQDE